MRPISIADWDDAPGLVDQPVPGLTAMGDDVVLGGEGAVGQPVVMHRLGDSFRDVQLRARRQQGDMMRHVERGREVPSALVEQQHGVAARADHQGDFSQVLVSGLRVAFGQHGCGALALLQQTAPKVRGEA